MWRAAVSRAAFSVVVASLAASSWLGAGTASARGLEGLRADNTVAVAELPRQGQQTYVLILQGGPFPHEKDGTVFGNRERLLPRMKRGYYREYTVRTPGERSRGARRIICGGQQPQRPDACYYTEDHYSSFRMIVE